MAHSCTVVTPAVEIECRMPPGIGQDLRVTVTIGDQSSNLSPSPDALSYAAPVVMAIIPEKGVPTEGGLMTIAGSEFAHEYVKAHSGAVQVQWGNRELRVASSSDSQIVVEVGPGLLPDADLAVAHLVRSPAGSVVQVVRSEPVPIYYAPPHIDGVTVTSTETAASSISGWLLRILVTGTSFGPGGRNHEVFFYDEPIPSRHVLAWSHRHVEFWAPARDSASVGIKVRGLVGIPCDPPQTITDSLSSRPVLLTPSGPRCSCGAATEMVPTLAHSRKSTMASVTMHATSSPAATTDATAPSALALSPCSGTLSARFAKTPSRTRSCSTPPRSRPGSRLTVLVAADPRQCPVTR